MKTFQIGDAGEASFMFAAILKGLVVSKPFGSAEHYDYVVDNGKRLFKVQIKAANIPNTAYKGAAPTFGNSKRGISLNKYKKLIDVLVCYNITSNTFYLFPAKDIPNQKIRIGAKSKYDVYKNNWSVFK